MDNTDNHVWVFSRYEETGDWLEYNLKKDMPVIVIH